MHDIGQIYNETLDMVYAYVYKRIGNREVTEDIVSETYMTFIEVIEKHDGKSKMSTFIIGIAINKMRQYWQKHQNHIDLDEVANLIPAPHNAVREEAVDNALVKMLPAVLDTLKDRERRVVELRFLEGYSIKETAAETGLSDANVRVIQHRALAKAQETALTMLPPPG